MKTINVTFTNKEFARLLKHKKKMQPSGNWHTFILSVVKGGLDNGK